MKGVGVALVTPFTEDGAVDYTALTHLVEHVIAGGVDYLVVLGTTAETPTLSQDNGGRLPIILGAGGNCTADVVSYLRTGDFDGIDAILSVTPYYNKPSQEGIYQHYKAVAEASPCSVVLYNVPGRTGVNMSPATVLRLVHDCPKIIAVKEASGSLSQAANILKGCPADFAVVSGDDNLTLPMVALGGAGVISVAANVFPEKFCKMVHLALEGRFAEAAPLHLSMMETVDALFAEGNPSGVKAALSCCGLIENRLRLPLVPVSEQLRNRIGMLLKSNDLR